MTTGVYRLIFKGTDKVYIGQSVNIERRFHEHIHNLIKGVATYKLMDAYNTYGNPLLDILVECSVDELALWETQAIEIFDSITNGYNILDGKSAIKYYGETNGNSKHTNEEYYAILKLLITKPIIPNKDIAKICGVTLSIVSHISSMEKHSWLGEVYPLEYAELQRIKSEGRRGYGNTSTTIPLIKSPEGIIHEVLNGTRFARDHGLDQTSISRVLSGKLLVHKGWALPNYVPPSPYPPLISPQGDIYIVPFGKLKGFADPRGLASSNLHSVIIGKAKTCKGWRLATEEEVALAQ